MIKSELSLTSPPTLLNQKFLVLLLVITFMGWACQEPKDEEEIKKQIEEFYLLPQDIYSETPNSNILSSELVRRIEIAKEVTEKDRKRIQESDHPTDKPLLLEGCVFASLYDGFHTFHIKEIAIENDTAKAVINLEYASDPSEKWSDLLILVNEGGWKVDNVIFAPSHTGDRDLWQRLDLTRF
ncbi:hypothetical protein [Algoriphagus taiwanensis]|uniref:DUF3828 domain-containing protein n=1 Tax=Algoriphagus taiwanensis TaxID=1445656 RepID=A0ABQ6Q2I5_9BACT|nr:hypothetical protein Ataiwa_23680 [Algoriphagus taiwanensis]